MENLHRTLSKEIERGKERSEQQFSEGKMGRRRVQNYKRAYRVQKTGKERKRAKTFKQISGRDREQRYGN